MARTQSKGRPRRGPSPLVAQLRNQLASQRNRTRTAKAELSKTYGAPVVIGVQAAAGLGGGLAGLAVGFLGDGMLGKGVVIGVSLLLVGLGAFLIPGAFGAGVACIGGGMWAKLAGDFTETLSVDFFGGGEPAPEGM